MQDLSALLADRKAAMRSAALRFVIVIGVVSFFADFTYLVGFSVVIELVAIPLIVVAARQVRR